MTSNNEPVDKKKATKGSYAVGILNQLGTAAKRAYEDGTLARMPRELLTQHDSSPKYAYSVLPTATSIRLLEVSASNPGDLIQCKIYVVDLRSRPKYIALSYSWEKDGSWTKFAAGVAGDGMRKMGIRLPKSSDKDDDPDDDHGKRLIMCNGRKMMVQANLYDALLQFRRVAPGRYWVDAVCINQKDGKEKAQQMQMMSDIYRTAESVTIWLGKCPQLISRGISRLEIAQGDIWQMKKEDDRAGKKQMLGDDSEPHAFYGAAYLLSRRWFGRLWVVQEFCLARRMIIQFGEHRIRPETIACLVQSFKDILEGKKSRGKEQVEFEMEIGSFYRPFWGQHLEFVPVLFESRALFQQDQSLQLEDAVTASSPGPRLWPKIRATSGADRFEVFLNLAACLLTQSQSVFLLSLGSLGNDPRLPSWVPDPEMFTMSITEPFAYREGTNFGACITSLASPKISPDGRTLYLRAARIGTVDHLLKHEKVPAFNLVGEGSDIITLLELATKIPVKYGPAQESGLHALARTLIADSSTKINPVVALIKYLSVQVSIVRDKLNRLSKPKQRSVEEYISRKIDDYNNRHEPNEQEAKRLARRLEEVWAKLKSIYPDQPWTSSDAKTAQELTSEERNYVEIASKINAWRVIFLTREGQLGLGGVWIKEGQSLMLVESGYVPYVFKSAEQTAKEHMKSVKEGIQKLLKEPQPLSEREEKKLKELKKTLDRLQSTMHKQAGTWAINGEAYIHGIMHGEAMNESLIFEPIAVN
ncbi:heterokaryon incompatibility protein-domain-containing protein [Xylaria arbuscula]|nr:heterokaryon incompatibility protein-domain-containing protein [Xylaria arbuscula]